MSDLRETSAAVFILPAHTGRPSRSWPRGCAEGCRANPSRGSAVSRPRCAVPLPPPLHLHLTHAGLQPRPYEGCSEIHLCWKSWRTYGNPNCLLINSFVGMIKNMHFFFLLVLCVNAFYITAASFTTPDLCWPQFRWELKYRRTLTRVSEMLCLPITIKMQK